MRCETVGSSVWSSPVSGAALAVPVFLAAVFPWQSGKSAGTEHAQ